MFLTADNRRPYNIIFISETLSKKKIVKIGQ